MRLVSGGAILCLAAAAGYGAAPVLARTAYDAGLSVATLLTLRFALASGVLTGVAALSSPTLPRRSMVAALLIGATLMAPAAILYFTALETLDPGTAALIVYTYPAIVAITAWLAGWERATPRMAAAVVAVVAGVALVSSTSLGGSGTAAGVFAALAAAFAYAGYLLTSSRLLPTASGRVWLATLTCGGALVSIAVWGAATGGLQWVTAPRSLLIVAVIAIVCTALPGGADARGALTGRALDGGGTRCGRADRRGRARRGGPPRPADTDPGRRGPHGHHGRRRRIAERTPRPG